MPYTHTAYAPESAPSKLITGIALFCNMRPEQWSFDVNQDQGSSSGRYASMPRDSLALAGAGDR